MRESSGILRSVAILPVARSGGNVSHHGFIESRVPSCVFESLYVALTI
jgi:hypothetical protein